MPNPPTVLWLHTQPEHYFNCMIDDLNKSHAANYIAAFSHKGPGTYKDTPLPAGKSLLLTPLPSQQNSPIPNFKKYHANWRSQLLPLNYNMVIVSGYASRTHREVIKDAHQRRIPVAMWSDSNLRSQRGKSLKARLRRRVKKAALHSIIKNTDYLLTTNSLGIAYWRYYGAPKNKIIRCPYYSDYSRIDTARSIPRDQALAKFNRLPNDRILFTAARLVPAKALELAIHAFKNSDLPQKNFHYLIAGTGPLEADLKQQAGNLLNHSIHFLGFQQPKDIFAIMAHADLFILPSRYEPHGIVIPESLASATPVLASDVCGAAADLVFPQISGDLFQSENPADLRKKLTALLENPEKLAAIRYTSRKTFEQWFAQTNPIQVITTLVQKALAAK